LFRTSQKHSKYCENCKELKESIRVTKIRIADYQRNIVVQQQLLIRLKEQEEEIIKENDKT